MKISIIVPVYNTDKYLNRCVDSILAQTIRDFELILIDDGSTDGSSAICDDYAQKDSRVKVIHKPNGGVSSARNVGLDIAQGEYVGFVDSDDYIYPRMYEALVYHLEETGADIAQCGLTHFQDEEDPFEHDVVFKDVPITVFQRSEMISQFADLKRIFISTIWNKLYRRKIFDDIRFPLNVYMEDGAIQLATIDAASTVVVFPTIMYGYRQRSESLTHSKYTPHSFQGAVNMLNNAHFFRKNGIEEQANIAFDQFAIHYCRNKFAVYLAYPEYKSAFRPVEKMYLRNFWQLLRNPCICRLKKLMLLILFVNARTAYKLCLKYFPECISHS